MPRSATHQVTNQPPPLAGYNVFRSDRALAEAVTREGGGRDLTELDALGALAGSPEAIALGAQANDNPPQLRTHDRFGNRVDEVDFHPSWHRLLDIATHYGLHGSAWAAQDPDAHRSRAAKFFVWAQVEAGHGCPISMTYAAVPALRAQPEVARQWEPLLAARAYDPRALPALEKSGALCGMAMTEKQGGSDVRANTTRAVFAEQTASGDAYLLTGHKWFCSAPTCDAFLVLAQCDAGLTCFLMPRVRADGSRNRMFLQRLKDKLGNRSNASSEIELDDAWALRVGDEGRGVQTIVEMVNCTRLDCINGSAALMRQALAQAIHHAAHRSAFGKTLIDQPLMGNVLADLALESEAATAFLMRLARAADESANDSAQAALKRLGTAVGKYWICKRAPAFVAEALECLGGNGYVEESGMPRLYREAPLNSIWEGSGNINALDVVRIVTKAPEAIEAFGAEIAPALHDRHLSGSLDSLRALSRESGADAQRSARAFVETLALVWQGALLVQHAPAAVSDAFLASRLAGNWGRTFGTLPSATEQAVIVARAAVAL
ncbi:MAG TPA: acyl-CoA dehydrogenase family protein [Candidatus Baltobacteraceae bacterium]